MPCWEEISPGGSQEAGEQAAYCSLCHSGLAPCLHKALGLLPAPVQNPFSAGTCPSPAGTRSPGEGQHSPGAEQTGLGSPLGAAWLLPSAGLGASLLHVPSRAEPPCRQPARAARQPAPACLQGQAVLLPGWWLGTIPAARFARGRQPHCLLFRSPTWGGEGLAAWPAPGRAWPAQAAPASSLPSLESGSKPQHKQYKKKKSKENFKKKRGKTERLLFPRSHTLFVGCSGAGKQHGEGVRAAHPAGAVQEVRELQG